jgi:hypothetical protein
VPHLILKGGCVNVSEIVIISISKRNIHEGLTCWIVQITLNPYHEGLHLIPACVTKLADYLAQICIQPKLKIAEIVDFGFYLY